jgi:phospholipase A1/A2
MAFIKLKAEEFPVNKLSLGSVAGAVCAVLLCVVHADASAESAVLLECTLITSEKERLACYDRVAGFSAAPDAAAPDRPSMIDTAWGFAPGSNRHMISLYRPNYIQPVRYSDDVNQAPFSPIFDAAESDERLKEVEARFQLSFKNRVWAADDLRWGFWFAYTQTSQWQIYSDEISRPFRETNYMPELFVSYRPGVQVAGFDWNLWNFGYIHQSNGRSQVLSRSWDRLITELGFERGDFALLAKAWWRIPESSNEDDNSDINRYMGYGDLTALYKWRGHSFSLMGRGNWNTGKGAAQFTWTTPPLLGPLRGYVQAFSGYGDSMIDYNWNQNIIGIGVALNDIL